MSNEKAKIFSHQKLNADKLSMESLKFLFVFDANELKQTE